MWAPRRENLSPTNTRTPAEPSTPWRPPTSTSPSNSAGTTCSRIACPSPRLTRKMPASRSPPTSRSIAACVHGVRVKAWTGVPSARPTATVSSQACWKHRRRTIRHCNGKCCASMAAIVATDSRISMWRHASRHTSRRTSRESDTSEGPSNSTAIHQIQRQMSIIFHGM